MATRDVGATMEPSCFSPCVSQRELWELESGFAELELLCLCNAWLLGNENTTSENT
jgi:hypothetical protein